MVEKIDNGTVSQMNTRLLISELEKDTYEITRRVKTNSKLLGLERNLHEKTFFVI